jgi:N-methylhydantoinase B
MTGFDVVKAEISRKALEAITKEMAITLVRTSGSPVVTDAKDFCTTILDEQADQIAFSGFVTLHVSTSFLAVQAVAAVYPLSDLRPGDAFICNDPHTSGANHQADVGIVMPYFYKNQFIGWGYCNEHVLDIGGSSISGFAPEARDCFAEALRFSGIRFMQGGVFNPEWQRFIHDNVRVPTLVLNDLRSMVAALNVGQKRLNLFIDDFGLVELRKFNQLNKELSERMVRDLLKKLPDGEYFSEEWIEYDGHEDDLLLHLACRLIINGDQATVELRGDPQIDAFVNGAKPAVLGMAMAALLVQLLYDVPVNSGIWRPFHFDFGPPGTIVNPLPPAPVTAAHSETGARIGKLVHKALSQALALSSDPTMRSRIAGHPHNAVAMTTLTGVERKTGALSVVFPISPTVGTGSGGQTTGDGLDTYSTQANVGVGLPAVEIEESMGPVMILWRKIQPNSSGPGIYRGGQGTSTAVAIVGADVMTGTTQNNGAEVAPSGFAGGMAGGVTDVYILRDTNLLPLLHRGIMPTRDRLHGTVDRIPTHIGSLRVVEGDVFVYTGSGGGGLGSPVFRDVASVLKDVDDGYVTVAAARTVYGVVLDAVGEVDNGATASERRARLKQTLGHKPSRDAVFEHDGLMTIGIGASNGAWVCNCCGENLGDARTNFRDLLIEKEILLSDRFSNLDMYARGRPKGEPQVVIRGYFCPACGICLCEDVTVEGHARLHAPVLHSKRRR